MITLKDILITVDPLQIVGDTAMPVSDLIIDSRKVVAGVAFVAMRGTTVDGHDFIDKAVAAGAIAVVCEILPATTQSGVLLYSGKGCCPGCRPDGGCFLWQSVCGHAGNRHYRYKWQDNNCNAAVSPVRVLRIYCGLISTDRIILETQLK
jgi:hypothetical protein